MFLRVTRKLSDSWMRMENGEFPILKIRKKSQDFFSDFFSIFNTYIKQSRKKIEIKIQKKSPKKSRFFSDFFRWTQLKCKITRWAPLRNGHLLFQDNSKSNNTLYYFKNFPHIFCNVCFIPQPFSSMQFS